MDFFCNNLREFILIGAEFCRMSFHLVKGRFGEYPLVSQKKKKKKKKN